MGVGNVDLDYSEQRPLSAVALRRLDRRQGHRRGHRGSVSSESSFPSSEQRGQRE